MKYYIGLDVSVKTVSICILNEQGKAVYEDCVETHPDIIANAIKSTNLPIEKIALETGGISHWLTKELKKLGLPVICIDARKMAAAISMRANKTDKNDAREIANALRTGYIKEVYNQLDSVVEATTLLTSRRLLVDQRTQLINCIRGILRAQGKLQCGTSQNSTKFAAFVRELIKTVPSDVQSSVEALLTAFIAICKEVNTLEIHIEKIAYEDKDIQLLMTIPGVGVMTATTYKLEIGDPKRFKNSKSVGAFVGMTPTQYSSGETKKQGSISKSGSKELRSLLIEAAMCLMYCTKSWSKLKAFGWRVRKKHGHKIAVVAVGRKLAVIMHRMLIDNKRFEPGAVDLKEIEKILKSYNLENKKKSKKEHKAESKKMTSQVVEALV